MADTYCGKNCAECMRREELACLGCKAGPGRSFVSDCDLAKCARDKGHETCDTCIFKGNCGTLRGRESVPDYRIKSMEAEAQRKAAIAKRAPVLGKWLWLIFWLIILSIPVTLLTNGSIVGVDTPIAIAGHIMSAAMSIAIGVAFWKMTAEEERYRRAGICVTIAAVINLVLELVPDIGEGIFLLASILVTIVGLVWEYNEYKAHAAVLTGADNALSEKWETLWKWYIGLLCGMFGSLLVMLVIPVLGALAILAATIGGLVVSILKLVYLYRTANTFRRIQMGCEIR